MERKRIDNDNSVVYFILTREREMIELSTLRNTFINDLCQKFKVTSLNELYDKDPSNFVRKITIPYKETLKKLTPYFPDQTVRPVERLYHILYNYYESHPVKCKICGIHPTEFTNEIKKGYRQYCSTECRLADTYEINRKAQNTYFEKTGYENASQDPLIKQKKKETTIKNYGCEHINYSVEVVKKRQNKYLAKTGYLHPFQNPDVKNKSKQTYLKHTGFENPSLNPEVIQKRATNYQIKTGFACSLQNPDIQNKIHQTWLQKYGVDNPAKSPDIQQRMSQTQRSHFFSRLLNSERLKSQYEPQFSIDDYVGVKENKKYSWKCLKCGTIFVDDIDNGNLPRCTSCYPDIGVSLIESEVADFCKKYYNIETNNKSIITPYEIDIFIHELNLGIEFNGIYWHSELSGKKTKEYHQYKLFLALQNKNNLIQIFEDEWLYKQNIVKSILLNKFGKNQNKIFARKCQIFSVYPEDARQFYFNNHIQGFINGTHLGLFYNGEIVSMITFGTPRFELSHETEIYRFCNKTNTSVIGGLSKLIKAMISVSNTKSIVTYADARYGLGLGYAKCGFKFQGTTDPGYYYVKIGTRQRISRNQFQKHMLKNKLKDFDPTLTEWENMQMNRYDRIWDCGNFVYEMIL